MIECRRDLSRVEGWIQGHKYCTELEQSICDSRELNVVSQLYAYPVALLHA